MPPARKTSGMPLRREAKRISPRSRRRCAAGRPPREAAGTGSRRRRSGSGRWRGPAPARRRAARPARPRSAAGVPAATQSGARSAAGPSAAGGGLRVPAVLRRRRCNAGARAQRGRPGDAISDSAQPHAGRDADLDEARAGVGPRAIASQRGLERPPRPRPAGGNAVALGDRGDVERRQVEPGAPSTPSASENHLRIAYSELRRTRNVTGVL